MIRIPDAGRFELRLADGAANPYLLQAGDPRRGPRRHRPSAIRASGSTSTCTRDGHTVETKKLPLNLLDALRLFEASPLLSDLAPAYVKLKRAEWEAYARHLSPWERENTLDV